MSGSQSLYTGTPRQIRRYIKKAFYAGLVPYTKSSPGMGKSSIYRSVADELNLQLIDHRLSTSEPTDLSGLPQFVNGKARFAPFEELFPLEDTPLPPGKQGWLIFLDEFNSAHKAVQAAAYKLILDRMVGQHRLHPNVVVGAAGNLDTDRAITTQLSTAMQSRVVHLRMALSFKEWLEDVALAEGYDSRVIGYLSQYESKLMDFHPDHNEDTFCCPRTWEFMNRLVQDSEVLDEDMPLYAGTITSGVAVEFVQFTKVYKDLVKVADIERDPEGCPVPYDNSTKWATITHMMEKITEKNLEALSNYANRFPLDFRVLFFRSLMVRHGDLRHHPAYASAMLKVSKYLHS